MDPDFPVAHWFLGWVHYHRGDFGLALSALNKAYALSPSSRLQADIAFVHARSGDRAEALRILESLRTDADSGKKYVSQYSFALIYTGLGDRDRAFAALDNALEERPWDLSEAKVSPLLDPLRSDRRFPELLRRLGLSVL
jgi:tetratricopeptide (TPR) repeat protein